MLNIKQIRENPDEIIKSLARRNKDYSVEIKTILNADERRCEILSEVEKLKAEQNAVSKKIPAMKKAGEDTTEILASMKELSAKIPKLTDSLREVEETINKTILVLPNTPNTEIPDGLDSDQNTELRKVGTPAEFSFEPKPHWEIGEKLGILDPGTAAKVTGARFHFYRGLGARLERAVVNLFLDTHTSRGYTEIFPPYMVNRASMTGTGQLPKFEEDSFKIENTDYFLIPTAEVPVTNMHRDEILAKDNIPLRYCAYSACFRAEAGSAGRDTRGLIRQHQFNKVELVSIVKPENSYDELEKLTLDAEEVLKLLELPYRVVTLCAGDLGFSSAKTYDIEVWMPSYGRYVEISSCSNFENFQARRANIKYRADDGKTAFAHTLNGSGVAVGRTVAAILENFQNEDGTVNIPEVLQKYMGENKLK